MPYVDVESVRLCYEETGPSDGEPLVLIHGLGAQLVAWHPGFCHLLEDGGFRVIRFDNRDVGLSSKMDEEPSYSLADMADDVLGLLDALGMETAHLLGQSMGGMIAQEAAVRSPHRVASVCSIYSAPNASYLTDDPAFWEVTQRSSSLSREEAIQEWLATERLSGLAGLDQATAYQMAAAIYDRNYCPAGLRRQAHAMLAAPDRSAQLAQLNVPTAVIHGRADPIISFHGGIATATAIPGAELHLFAETGHQIPPSLWQDFVRVIVRNAERASMRAVA